MDTTTYARKVFAAAIIAVCLPCSAQLHGKQRESGLVGVKDYGWRGLKATGTGFWVSRNHVLTARHCATGNLTVQTGDGCEYDAEKVSSGYGWDDWALLYVANPPKHAVLCLEKRKLGYEISRGWCYGDFRVSGGTIQVQSGTIAGTNCGAQIRPGFSGGPVVNSAGNVVGIVSQERLFDSTCIFVPAGAVRW